MRPNSKDSVQLQQKAVEELRHIITGKNYLDQNKLESNSFLLRYLKFFHMDVSKAEKAIKNYWKYCNSKKLECFVTEIPNKYKDIFQIFAGARDHQNRPVIQIPNIGDWLKKLNNDFDKQDELVLATLIKQMHWQMETELLAMDADYAVMILDFKDMPYTFSFSKRLLKLVVDSTKELMPISPDIAQTIILNAPKIIKVLTTAAHSLLRFTQEQRNRCVVFSPSDADWKEQILNFVPANQLRPEFGGTFTGSQMGFE
ncbi:unnamed protein product [Allacma fusca]|uniref:CRAL-TRIO domain-containing protein n=1 Tax=Allacma fusca TaxID=39272 RepID=A0A8J2JWU6_9HEXA|nr:unnamed protein product [Allacma fusca]